MGHRIEGILPPVTDSCNLTYTNIGLNIDSYASTSKIHLLVAVRHFLIRYLHLCGQKSVWLSMPGHAPPNRIICQLLVIFPKSIHTG